jgi:hypothetical protein
MALLTVDATVRAAVAGLASASESQHRDGAADGSQHA